MNAPFRSIAISRGAAHFQRGGSVGRALTGWAVGCALAAVIAALASPALAACFGAADLYAVEVVLNKPGVEYDLAKLAGAEGVAEVDYFIAYAAYMYRSHYDERLVVVVSVQGLRYANVRAAGSGPAFAVAVRGLRVSVERLAEGVDRARSELGWRVEARELPGGRGAALTFTKEVKGAEVEVSLSVLEAASGNCTVRLGLLVRGVESVSDELAAEIQGEVERLLDRLGLSALNGLVRASAIKRALAGRAPEQERYAAVRIQVPLRQEVVTATVHECRVEYSSEGLNASELRPESAERLGWEVWVRRAPGRGCVGFVMVKELGGVKLRVEGEGRGREVRLVLRVEGADALSGAVLSELRRALEAMGLRGELVSEGSFERFEESVGARLVPAYNVTEEEVREALKAELRWLLEKGVISGLSEGDVEAIASAARLGCAGWNDRLVWSSGRWVPYRLTEGARLLRLSLPPPRFAFPEEELGGPASCLLYTSPSPRD